MSHRGLLWIAAGGLGLVAQATACNGAFGIGDLTFGAASTGAGGATASGSSATGGAASVSASMSSSAAATGGTGGGTGGGGGNPPMCDEDPCAVVAPQCGCPAGQNCAMVGAVRECIDAGTATDTESCQNAPCAVGYHCGGASDHRICFPYCTSHADCNGPGGHCIQASDGNGGMLSETVCTENCDLTSGAACKAPGSKCTAGDFPQIGWISACIKAGSGTNGDACANDGDCAAGFGCVSNTTCRQMCKIGIGGCVTGSCSPFDPALVIGNTEYGACT